MKASNDAMPASAKPKPPVARSSAMAEMMPVMCEV
jgi:hypothetical protein